MPRYKRKRWVKFVKKVKAATEEDMGLQRIIFNDSGTYNTTNLVGGVRQQAVFGAILYSGNGTPNTSYLGVSDIQRVIDSGLPEVSIGQNPYPSIQPTTKFKFTSGVMDYTITSDSSNGSALECDIYYIRYRKGWGNITGNNDLSGMFQYYIEKDKILGGGLNKDARIYYRGVTLFEQGTAIGSMGLQIISKAKYYIAPGNSINVQIRDPKSHSLEKQDVGDGSNGLAYSNWTQGYICIAKPTRDLGAEASFIIHAGCTRTYKYQIEGIPASATRYVS